MNKIVPEENKNTEHNDMRPEYDFSGGVRGKHYQAYPIGKGIP